MILSKDGNGSATGDILRNYLMNSRTTILYLKYMITRKKFYSWDFSFILKNYSLITSFVMSSSTIDLSDIDEYTAEDFAEIVSNIIFDVTYFL